MRNLKNDKGITLIALIVTIIVWLILSGVGIAMLTGENSIVKKAIHAKKATSEAEAKERVQIEVLGSIDNKGNIDKDKLKNNLRDNLGVQDNQIVDPNEGTDFNDPFDFPLEDYDVRVNPNGKVEIMPKGEIPTPPTLNDGDIIFSVNPSTLTNEEVQVAVKVNSSINSMRLTLQYALEQPDEEESWQTYKRPVTFKDNGPIYARLINEKGQKSNYATGNINNIDKQPPTIDEFKVVEDSITLNSVQVQVTASDNCQLASKDPYKFFAKEENGALYPTSDYKLKGVESQGEFTYKDLTPSKKYELKVIVTDEAGNTENQSINDVQMKMPELNVGGEESPEPTGTPGPGESPSPSEPQKANITFKYSYTEWNNLENVNVTIGLSDELKNIDTLKLQYQTPNEENTDWQDYQEDGFKITKNGSIYARLIEKEGTRTTNTATSSYSKFDREEPELSEIEVTNTSTNNISVSVTATDKPDDNPSGLLEENAYTYMIDTTESMNEIENSVMIMGEPMGASDMLITESSNEPTHTFTGLTHGTDYTIKVMVMDKAQNMAEQETTQTTEKIPDLSQEGELTFDVTPKGWTNKEQATVRINTKEELSSNLKIQYQTLAEENTEWQDYNKEEGFTITKNGTINAKILEISGEQTSTVATYNYNFFDRKLPEITIETEEPTVEDVKVNVTSSKDDPSSPDANDASGLLDENKYTYYIEEVGGSLGETAANISDETLFTYGSLLQGKQYKIRVEVKDNAGNIGTSTTETITAKTIPDLNDADSIKTQYTPSRWTNEESVKVTLTSKYTEQGYKLQYSTDYYTDAGGKEINPSATWHDYEDGFNITDNQKFGVRLKLESKYGQAAQYGKVKEEQVTWIDRVAPEINILEGEEITTNSAKISIKTNDTISGIDEEDGKTPYKYYIVEGEVTNPEEIQNKTQSEKPKETTNKKEYTFTELTQNTTYTIIVTAEDRATNTNYTTKVINTEKIPDLNVGEGPEQQGNITFKYSKSEWNNDENVKVTIELSDELKAEVSEEQGGTSENAKFKLQYQASKEETGETWQDYQKDGFDITQNGSIFARLIEIEGTQTSSGTATSNYSFFDREVPIVNEITDEDIETTNSSIKVTIHATDEDSGIKEYKYYLDGEAEDNLKATQPAQTENPNEDSYTFDGLDTNSTHTVIVKVTDKATNEGKAEKTDVVAKVDYSKQIGKYVKYEPDKSDAYKSEQAHNGYQDQTISQETLNWRILDIGTGENGLEKGEVKIISDVSSKDMTYKGAIGYNNIVKDLNDMCETLYSHGNTKARSVNLEDFKGQPGVQQSTSSGSASFTAPVMWNQETGGGGTLDQSEQPSWISGSTTSSNKYANNYWYNSSEQITSSNPLYDSQSYFLASRCVRYDSGGDNYWFGVQRWIGASNLDGYNLWHYNLGIHENAQTYHVRAVAILPVDAVLDTESTNGDTPETAYNIKWPPKKPTDMVGEIGKYVKYEPSGGSTTYSSTQAHNGNTDTTVSRENLNWRILSVDGDSVKIISDINSTNITYKGAEGYNNIVKDLNEMCKTLYSHGTTYARSVNLDDFTNKSQTYTAGQYSATCPTIYPQEKVAGGTLNQSQQNDWVTGSTTSTSKMGSNSWSGSLQNTDPLYSSTTYFLASRCVEYGGDWYYWFHIQYASSGLNTKYLYHSYLHEFYPRRSNISRSYHRFSTV